MRRIGQIIEDIDLQGKSDELINELVALSTKHGILTPYTSFLADDINAPRLASLEDNRRRAATSLDALGEAEGRTGVAQRAEKFSLKKSENSSEQLAGDATARPGAGGFGAAGGAGPALAPTAKAISGKADYARASNATYREAKDDKKYIATNVQQIGQTGLYMRNNTWYAANAIDVDEEKQAKEINKVARFSDEYFKLTKENTEDENAVFASQVEGESLVIRLRGKIYRIE
jgi:Ca-activated chloride channel homolog